MRPGQQNNKRMRGRGRKGPNPLSRSYESNGPDVKIRGTAQHIAERYTTLARDATSAGDRVMAENYFQHAEHYGRIVAAAQGSFQLSQPDQDGDEDEVEEGGEFAPNGNGQNGNAQNNHQNGQPQHRSDNGQGFRERNDRSERDHQRPRGERGDFRNDRGDRGDRFERGEGGRDRNRDFQRGDRRDFQPNGERQGEDRGPRPERQDRQDRNDRGERRFEDRGRRFDQDAPRAPVDEERRVSGEDATDAPVATHGDDDGAVAPRRRGRPPRQRIDEPNAEVPLAAGDSPASISADAPVEPVPEAEAPRRRGRPPRAAAPETSGEDAAAEPVAKRRPGRPRRVRPEDEASGGEGEPESQLPAFLLASNG